MKKANTAWMIGSYGISVHWTADTVCQDGTALPYEEAVNQFNPEAFADSIADAGAKHCIFTLTHAKEYLALPHPVLEKILPGRSTKRDLIGEIIDALDKRDIRFIAYYNHSCNGNGDAEWKEACGYAAGIKGNLDQFAENICGIVEFIARRYGNKLCGWWFDSSYSVDPNGPYNTVTCDMGDWQFPWEALAAAARSGNQDCAVTFNAGVGTRFLYAGCQDYYAGETVSLDEVFLPEAEKNMQDHRWICADSADWLFTAKNYANGFSELRFPAEELKAFRSQHCAAGRMVTFNFQIDQLGNINPAVRKLT